MPAGFQKDLVSEAAQTQYRDSETQFLEWDVAENPTVHPDKFYRGIGLHYPVLYDPAQEGLKERAARHRAAWPVHIAHRRKEGEKKKKKAGSPGKGEKKQKVPGSYALTGVTLGDAERHPIKKTLVFPHRNTDLPFRQPPAVDVREPTFELCEKLTLQEINEIETRIILKPILEKLINYDKTNKKARIKALQKLLNIHPKAQDKGPPLLKQHIKPKWRQAIEDKGKSLAAESVEDEPEIVPQIILVNSGPKCPICGFSAATQKHFCSVHKVEEEKEEDIVKSDVKKDKQIEVDEGWCRMCSGRNLHRKVYGEDHSNYPPAPIKPKEQDKEKDKGKDEEI